MSFLCVIDEYLVCQVAFVRYTLFVLYKFDRMNKVNKIIEYFYCFAQCLTSGSEKYLNLF